MMDLLCLLINDGLQILTDCAITKLLFTTSSTRWTSIVHVAFYLTSIRIDEVVDRTGYITLCLRHVVHALMCLEM
jgi:hypothetical protein